MNKEDINKLVSLAKIGDQRAFTKLFEYFYPIVFRLTKSSFKSNETAEDMAMEAMEKVFSKIDKYEDGTTFEFWVKRLTINHIIDYVRLLKNKTVYSEEIDDNVNSVVSDNNPEADVISKENGDTIKLRLELIPEKAKTILVLRQKGLTYEQIASKLKINIGTVKSQLNKIHAKLKKELN